MRVQTVRTYGWRADTPDFRDHPFLRPARGAPLPMRVDLRSKAPTVRDQGELGSCTGHGIRDLLAYRRPALEFSPLFIYYEERVIERTVSVDAGAEIRDGIKACAKVGACVESLWPYVTTKFAKRPTKAAVANAAKYRITAYKRLRVLDDVRAALAADSPVVFGFTVYESFESDEVARTGVVPMPSTTERKLGGHCVSAFGYDDTRNALLCMNSWGTGWGEKGYFWLPYAYITNRDLSDDFWTISA